MKILNQIHIQEEKKVENFSSFILLPFKSITPFENAMKSYSGYYEVDLLIPTIDRNLVNVYVKENTVFIGRKELSPEGIKTIIYRSMLIPADADELMISAYFREDRLVIFMPKADNNYWFRIKLLWGQIQSFFKKIVTYLRKK